MSVNIMHMQVGIDCAPFIPLKATNSSGPERIAGVDPGQGA
ncbi:hypothetical protein [Massilia sp. S19_KUP03_FR1]